MLRSEISLLSYTFENVNCREGSGLLQNDFDALVEFFYIGIC